MESSILWFLFESVSHVLHAQGTVFIFRGSLFLPLGFAFCFQIQLQNTIALLVCFASFFEHLAYSSLSIGGYIYSYVFNDLIQPIKYIKKQTVSFVLFWRVASQKITIRKTKIGLPQKESLVSVSQRFSGVLVNALAYFIHTSLKQLRTIGERPKELMDGLSLEGAAASGVCRETSWGWVWLDLLPKEVKNTLLSFF